MARKATTMIIQIHCTVDDDQLAVKVGAISLSGAVGDPEGANEYEKGPKNISARDTWDGTKTGDQITAACLASLKRAAGIP